MGKFFVSYSRSVQEEVREVVNLLNASGHEVWWDADIPAIAFWWETILNEIVKCEVFIFVVSRYSVESEFCLDELKYALEYNKPILPLVIDDQTALPKIIEDYQWLKYNGDNADLLNKINESYKSINWDRHKPPLNPPPPPIGQILKEARRKALKGKFEEAKKLFRDVRALAFEEWGDHCDKWISRLNSYEAIVDLIDDEGEYLLKEACTRWKDHKSQFGADFDPSNVDALCREIVWWRYALALIAVAAVIFGVILYIRGNGSDSNGNDTEPPSASVTEQTEPTPGEATSIATLTPTPINTPTTPPTSSAAPPPSSLQMTVSVVSGHLEIYLPAQGTVDLTLLTFRQNNNVLTLEGLIPGMPSNAGTPVCIRIPIETTQGNVSSSPPCGDRRASLLTGSFGQDDKFTDQALLEIDYAGSTEVVDLSRSTPIEFTFPIP